MIIVNDDVFTTDAGQPKLVHGTLDPGTQYALTELASLPVGTIYISKTSITGQPCNTTVTAACMWLKEGTAGSPCATAGSKSDWRRVGCGGFITGTTAPGSGSPWCEAEKGDIYEQSIAGQTWKLYWLKTGNDCDAVWLNLSKGCVFEDTHTPVGSMDADLCALPVASFVHVESVGTFLKIRNNCDGNDWVPLQTDLTNVEDMRNVTTDPNDAASGKPTYDSANRTLNIPPRVVIGIRRNLVTAGTTTVVAGGTSTVDFDTIDLDTSQNNGAALTLNAITLPFDGYYRFSAFATLIGKTAGFSWRANLTFNGSSLQRFLWPVAPVADLTETNAGDTFIGPLPGGTQIGLQLTNLDTTSSQYNSVTLTVEHLGS